MATPTTRIGNLTAAEKMFGDLSPTILREIESVTMTNSYPSGAVLFGEAEPARGIYMVIRGKVKLSVCASDGRTLILRVAQAGDALGVAASISRGDYEATAETLEPCDVSFIRQSDLIRLMRAHGEIALWVTKHLSLNYNETCREIRNLMLSESASEKLARLLVGWLPPSEDGETCQMKLAMTHEEIGQMIGTSRETVTRLFAGFKKQRLIQLKGSTLFIPNRTALESLITA
ncbi:MAG TPA: Crp/Fnr family transcriptional regulator [Terriglobales bacterium]|nr:Crp/Fnr family transcriptional regulator [Terriglobales bacterium]